MSGGNDWIDCYEILGLYDPRAGFGIGPDVTAQRLKSAHLHEMQKWAPDNYKMGSREWKLANKKSSLINQAYDKLKDPGEKEKYDRQWREKHSGKTGGPSQAHHEAQDNAVNEWWRKNYKETGRRRTDSEQSWSQSTSSAKNSGGGWETLASGLHTTFSDVLFIWWWVPAIGFNYLASDILPLSITSLMSWIGKILEGAGQGSNNLSGEASFLIIIVIWVLLEAIIIAGIVILLLLVLLTFALNYLWLLIAPLISAAIAIGIFVEFWDKRPKMPELGWQVAGAIVSLPAALFAFSIVLNNPASLYTYRGIDTSWGFADRLYILPNVMENFWFICLGIAGILAHKIFLWLKSTTKPIPVSN